MLCTKIYYCDLQPFAKVEAEKYFPFAQKSNGNNIMAWWKVVQQALQSGACPCFILIILLKI